MAMRCSRMQQSLSSEPLYVVVLCGALEQSFVGFDELLHFRVRGVGLR